MVKHWFFFFSVLNVIASIIWLRGIALVSTFERLSIIFLFTHFVTRSHEKWEKPLITYLLSGPKKM